MCFPISSLPSLPQGPLSLAAVTSVQPAAGSAPAAQPASQPLDSPAVPLDQNQVNPLLQNQPAGDAARVADAPSQVDFVDQPAEQPSQIIQSKMQPLKSDKQSEGGTPAETPGQFAQLGMLLGLAMAGKAAPSGAFDPVISKVRATSFNETSPKDLLNAQAREAAQVDTRMRSQDQPAETPPAEAPVNTPQPQPVPVSRPRPEGEQEEEPAPAQP